LFVAEIDFDIFENVILPKYFTLMLIKVASQTTMHQDQMASIELFIKKVLDHN